MAPESKPELVAIVGPTASGKSELAIKLAKDFNGEIIAADSWTVYKAFDIGTAKPGKSDKRAVKHHLLDVVEAGDGFNAALFQAMANKTIDDIQNRGKLPILVGGTGLYIDSILYNYGFLDTPDDAKRQRLNKLSLEELLIKAGKLKLDLTGIDSRNKRRVIRAIEAGGKKPIRHKLRPSTLLVGLDLGAEELNRRIESRVDKMLKQGLEKEVKRLFKKYGWQIEPMKGIGYREWRGYFEADQTLAQTKDRIIISTRQLVKKQRTWLKRNSDIKWFNSVKEAYEHLKLIVD